MPTNVHPFSWNVFRHQRDNRSRLGFRLHLTTPLSWRERGGTRRSFISALCICVALLIASHLWAQTAIADESLLRGPRKVVRARTETAEPAAAHTGILEDIAAAPVRFYQRFLGPAWGRSCSYYPSCSNYALMAIRKHGAILGSIMAFDRLQHEANEGGYSPQIAVGGEIKVYDPLENNDYWWYRTTHSESAAPAGAGPEVKP